LITVFTLLAFLPMLHSLIKPSRSTQLSYVIHR